MPPLREVQARRFVRKMRGETQAHLMLADDDNYYVVKLRDNPISHRILVNELISSLILRHLDIQTPEMVLVRLDEQTLRDNPDIAVLSHKNRPIPISPGLHLGSWYSGPVARPVIYDFLPDVMFPDVENRQDFFGALVFDKWASNGDLRQAVFRPTTGATDLRTAPRRTWIAQMIDHGLMFQGQLWAFLDSPPQGLYLRPIIYGLKPTIRQFRPWIERMMDLGTTTLEAIFDLVPPAWIVGEEEKLDGLLRGLLDRRPHVLELIDESIAYLTNRAQVRVAVQSPRSNTWVPGKAARIGESRMDVHASQNLNLGHQRSSRSPARSSLGSDLACISLLRAKIGLDRGGHFTRQVRQSSFS
jgi:hypothetical protein